MKESYWGYWLIILGIFIISVMLLLQNYTTTNEQDIYLIKEITDAAMTDALDLAHYRKYGEIRIIKEKFVENFVRRFSETININKTYKIGFYDISDLIEHVLGKTQRLEVSKESLLYTDRLARELVYQKVGVRN